MTQQKYSKLARNSPIRVAKYMSQCLSDSPPRGCDLEAAKADPLLADEAGNESLDHERASSRVSSRRYALQRISKVQIVRDRR